MTIVVLFHAWRLWLLLAGLWALWRADVYFHPFAPCVRCKGTGRNWGSRRTAQGLCKHGPLRVRFTGRRSADRQIERLRRP